MNNYFEIIESFKRELEVMTISLEETRFEHFRVNRECAYLDMERGLVKQYLKKLTLLKEVNLPKDKLKQVNELLIEANLKLEDIEQQFDVKRKIADKLWMNFESQENQLENKKRQIKWIKYRKVSQIISTLLDDPNYLNETITPKKKI